jgi:hypothetical protein
MKDPDTTDEVQIGHEIMNMFKYTYHDMWVPQKTIFRQDRKFVKVFNRLLKDGLITRKKTSAGYQYRWAGRMP